MIREAVLRALKRKRMSLRQLSLMSGVSYSRVHEWLSAGGDAGSGPKVENVEKMLAVLGLVIVDGDRVIPVERAKKKGGAR